MDEILFVLGLASVCGGILAWGISRLHRERWQFLAAFPQKRNADGTWHCRNLTYYGVLTAFSCTVAVALGAVLIAAIGVPAKVSFCIVAALLSLCVPAAKIVAWIVEKNRYRFTVGGAAFSGIVAAPFIAWIAGTLFGAAEATPVVSVCAALVSAYALGEGLGRLACLSYGCCYGRTLDSLPPAAQKFFVRLPFVLKASAKRRFMPKRTRTCAAFPCRR